MPIPKKTETINRTTAKERVYTILQQWIVDGTLEPGERLNDADLAKYFSVSRTPVREAIQMLNEQKLVEIVPSSGTFVAPINQEDIKHVYQLLGGLQALALKLCIGTMTAEDLEHLNSLNENFLRCAQMGAVPATIEADYQFHRYLCQLSGNPYLVNYSDQLSIHVSRNENRFFKIYTTPEVSYASHKRIIEALRSGDLETAQTEIEANWAVSTMQNEG